MRLSDVISNMNLAIWPQIALVMFVVIFASVLVRIYRRSRRDYEGIARLPIDDGVRVDPSRDATKEDKP